MKIYRTVAGLQAEIAKLKKDSKVVGFAPTMGALHNGHMSLVNLSRKHCDITVSSIFVNPTQFNDPGDLDKYPRTFDEDREMLEQNQCDILFYPTIDEIYPNGVLESVEVNLGGIESVLEGEFRPGHFDGVVQVVYRLLDIVKPDKIFMGQKDFQQAAIIQKMIVELKMPITLVLCPIIREKHGLAMSSRNERLPKKTRQIAKALYKTLEYTKQNLRKKTIRQLEKEALSSIKKIKFKPEYFKIVNGTTLHSVKKIEDTPYIVACLAAWAGNIRLIDNIILKDER